MTVEQLQKTGIFQFPLDIAIEAASAKSNIKTLSIDKKTGTFSIPVKGKPLRIVADPFTSLLFDGTIIELK